MTEIFNPRITILDNAADTEAHVADLLINQVTQKPNSVLTLPTGGTPIGVYRRLVTAHTAGDVDFSRVTTLNLDEYWPIQTDHPASYANYMDTHFFRHVNVPTENQNIPNGEAPDPDLEAERYNKIIARHTIDLSLVSIGPGETCHIGFNERGSASDSRTRYVPLDEQTMQANRRFFDNPEDMPAGAITQGVADILAAKSIILVATGRHKAWGVRRSLMGEISSDAPASFLRYHPDVSVVLDQAAASLLDQQS